MNIAIRKLAMLDKEFTAKEEAAKLEGLTYYASDPIFREKVARLMERVRVI